MKIISKLRKATTVIFEGSLRFIVERNAFFSLARPAHEWVEDIDPNVCIEKLRGKADIFTCWDRIPSKIPRKASSLKGYQVFQEQDNIAAVPLVSYDHWWRNQIGKKTRNMVKKAQKTGVEATTSSLSDELVRGLEKIFNETPTRQGRPFKHYGATFDAIKRSFKAVEKYPQEFVCALYNNELIGFIHLRYSNETAVIDQLLSMQKHWNKAPNNVLIAKAVEIACQKGLQHLIYEKMSGGSLGEFKRRNGFQKMFVTRYYIPLSFKGRLVLKLRLQRGLRGIMPDRLRNFLRLIRDRLLR